MALTKTTTDDRIEVVGDFKFVQIRTKTTIKEDGVELSSSFHRRMLNPGELNAANELIDTNISSESADVQVICNSVWSSAVKIAWKNELIANLPVGFSTVAP
tara:strand:- start:1842 stop:2147 length:306 start_codon:yes stop_codon:yes gene_type:complete